MRDGVRGRTDIVQTTQCAAYSRMEKFSFFFRAICGMSL